MNRLNFSALSELFLTRSLHRQKQQILNISALPKTQSKAQIDTLRRKDEGVLNSFLLECFDYSDGDFEKLESISTFRRRIPSSFLENQVYIEKKKEVAWNWKLKGMKENGNKRNSESSLRNLKVRLGKKEGNTVKTDEQEKIINKINRKEKNETVWSLSNVAEKMRESKSNGEWLEVEQMGCKSNSEIYKIHESLNKKETKMIEVVHNTENQKE